MLVEITPTGAKAQILLSQMARLKSGPDTKRQRSVVVFPKLSKLLYQEDALSAPCQPR